MRSGPTQAGPSPAQGWCSPSGIVPMRLRERLAVRVRCRFSGRGLAPLATLRGARGRRRIGRARRMDQPTEEGLGQGRVGRGTPGTSGAGVRDVEPVAVTGALSRRFLRKHSGAMTGPSVGFVPSPACPAVRGFGTGSAPHAAPTSQAYPAAGFAVGVLYLEVNHLGPSGAVVGRPEDGQIARRREGRPGARARSAHRRTWRAASACSAAGAMAYPSWSLVCAVLAQDVSFGTRPGASGLSVALSRA